MAEFRRLAEQFERLGVLTGSQLPLNDALALITVATVEAINGAEFASVTSGRPGILQTLAATSDSARLVDQIQYELASGPCIDAVGLQTVFRADDLRIDSRWPEFAARAVTETGTLSMLAFGMFFEEGDVVAGLNIYSTKPAAFDDLAQTTGLVLATHGALAFTSVVRSQRIENLQRALATNRDIGVAMGILMNRHLATKQQAFDLLRVASQHGHRKLGDIALEVIESGQLEYPAQSILSAPSN